MKQQHTKKTMLILAALCAAIALTACGYTAEEKEQIRQYEKQGEENAIAYIEEKYGFTPKVKYVTCEKVDSSPVPDFSPDPTGEVFVDMSYDKTQFRVYISGEEGIQEGCDNYQSTEIKKAIEEEVGNILTKIRQIDLSYGEFNDINGEENFGMVSTYFDGENLTEVLENSRVNRAIISTVGDSLENIEHTMITESFGNNAYYAVVNYRDEEGYRNMDNTSFNLKGIPIVNSIEYYALFVKDYVVLSADETDYTEYELEQYDNFYYSIVEGTYCEFEKTTAYDASNWNGRGFLNAKQIFDAYAMETDAKYVVIWIPYDELNAKKDDSLSIVTQFVYKGEDDYYKDITYKIAGQKYIVAQIYPRSFKDIVFTVLTDLEEK